jgi:hypothetical protein
MGWLVQAGDREHHEQDGRDKRGVHDGCLEGKMNGFYTAGFLWFRETV